MKKYKFKLVALLVAVALMLPNFTGAGALVESEVDDGLLTREEVERISALESPAKEAYEEIMYSWMDSQKNIVYPDEFGGCYLGNDYCLVITVLDTESSFCDSVLSTVDNPSIIRFEQADISYNELVELQDHIDTVVNDSAIYETSIDQKEGKVVVGVDQSAPISATSNAYSANNRMFEHIRFETINRPISNASCTPGEMFEATLSSSEPIATLGWYGTYSFNDVDRNCILTAGHVALGLDLCNEGIAVDNEVVVSASYIGNSNYSFSSAKMQSNGTVSGDGDFSFLTYTVAGGLYPINEVTRIAKSDTYPYPVVQSYRNAEITSCETALVPLLYTTVYKGTGYTGYRPGTVISTSSTIYPLFEYGQYSAESTYTNLVKVQALSNSFFCKPGDSGGPVISTGNNGFSLCGIIAGSREESSANYGFFTPMSKICAKGFTPYLG